MRVEMGAENVGAVLCLLKNGWANLLPSIMNIWQNHFAELVTEKYSGCDPLSDAVLT